MHTGLACAPHTIYVMRRVDGGLRRAEQGIAKENLSDEGGTKGLLGNSYRLCLLYVALCCLRARQGLTIRV